MNAMHGCLLPSTTSYPACFCIHLPSLYFSCSPMLHPVGFRYVCVFLCVCVCDQARKCSVSCQNAIETQNHQGFGYTLAFYALNAKIPFCPKTTAGQKMLREKFPYVMAAADAAESTNNHPNSLEFKYTERKVWLSYCCKVQFNSKPVYSVVFTYSSPFHGVEHTWRECSKANTMKF